MKKAIIAIVVVLIIAGGALYYFTLSGNKESKEVRVEYSPGEFFTTNVKESTKLFKSAVVLIVNAEGLEEKLKMENARIRDTIIFILRDLTEDEIRAPGNQDELRDRILTALNTRLGIDNFVEVLFSDYVMA